MADNKAVYSEIAEFYIGNHVMNIETEQQRYLRSKERERLFNDIWLQNKVNLNEIIDRFCPDYHVKLKSGKIVFKGKNFSVSADLAAGYLRIFDERNKRWVKLDGIPGSNEETHFKIMRREEM